jgi:hypothetical protein
MVTILHDQKKKKKLKNGHSPLISNSGALPNPYGSFFFFFFGSTGV